MVQEQQDFFSTNFLLAIQGRPKKEYCKGAPITGHEGPEGK